VLPLPDGVLEEDPLEEPPDEEPPEEVDDDPEVDEDPEEEPEDELPDDDDVELELSVLDVVCVVFDACACDDVCPHPPPISAIPRTAASMPSFVLRFIPRPRCPRFSLVTGGWSSLSYPNDTVILASVPFRELLDRRTNFGHSQPVRSSSIFTGLARRESAFFS
jgi:hypothetical protein